MSASPEHFKTRQTCLKEGVELCPKNASYGSLGGNLLSDPDKLIVKSSLQWMNAVLLCIVGPSEADNTVRENKNNCCLKMLCSILGKNLMSCAGMFFARTGHTHGPLGFLSAVNGCVSV